MAETITIIQGNTLLLRLAVTEGDALLVSSYSSELKKSKRNSLIEDTPVLLTAEMVFVDNSATEGADSYFDITYSAAQMDTLKVGHTYATDAKLTLSDATVIQTTPLFISVIPGVTS